MVDAAVSKTVEGQLSCRFESDLRHQTENIGVCSAELCSGSTGDFESSSPGSNPGSPASHNTFRTFLREKAVYPSFAAAAFNPYEGYAVSSLFGLCLMLT